MDTATTQSLIFGMSPTEFVFVVTTIIAAVVAGIVQVINAAQRRNVTEALDKANAQSPGKPDVKPAPLTVANIAAAVPLVGRMLRPAPKADPPINRRNDEREP